MGHGIEGLLSVIDPQTKRRLCDLYEEQCETELLARSIETYISNPRRYSRRKQNTADGDYEIQKSIVTQGCQTGRGCAEGRSRQNRERHIAEEEIKPASIASSIRFASSIPLALYAEHGFHRLPRVVNCVTMAMTRPRPGSKTVLPLDLHHVACRCNGTFFEPRRFAAAQLAFHKAPKGRVFVFHTGKIISTGTTGIMRARLVLSLAVEQLRREAGCDLEIHGFKSINVVGSSTIGATVNCESFAQDHTKDVHYDRSSFVGMVHRLF